MFGALFLILFIHNAAFTSASYIIEEECLNYTVYPLQYDIIITPHFYNGKFMYDGDIKITVIANVLTNVIELDAKDLVILGDSIHVYRNNLDIVNSPRPYTYDRNSGRLTIYLKEHLLPYKKADRHQYVIRIVFQKQELTERSYGVFISKYYNHQKQMRYMIQTRLSPEYARYFIPCFSNPRFESKFKFTVRIPYEHREEFNSSLVVAEEFKRNTLRDGFLEINYKESPQIYLSQVGFHASQYANIRFTSQYTNDTIIIWAPEPELQYCYSTLTFIDKLLKLIRMYSMVNRSLTTGPINIVPVSKDLNGYEVGSWNLLTNSDIRIMNYPQFISPKQLEQMYFELTQQLMRIWLGNPGEVNRTKWREDWFKEGVATYLAYYFLSQYDFGSNLKNARLPIKHYGLQMKHLAFNNDWLESTPALLRFDNEIAVNIPRRYKDLVTMKTASLLWMIENYVGSERFHPALIRYINNRRDTVKFISIKDFMESLDQDTVECFVGHKERRPSAILASWFKHPGYPVVHVHVLRDRSPNVIQLKQWRFTYTGRRRESKYLIPISYIVQDTSNCFNCHQAWFTTDHHSYTFEENLSGGWIMLNRNASGYYRVNYDQTTWKLIANTLKNDINTIDEMNRAQIANDVFALFVSGDLSQNLSMTILDFLDKERSFIVWEAVASGYETLKVDNANCRMTKLMYKSWQTFMRNKMAAGIYKEAVVDTYSYDVVYSGAHHTRLFRSTIIDLACSVEYKPCIANTEYQFKKWRANSLVRLHPDVRRACFRVAYNSSISTLDENVYNSFEMDDRKTAISMVQKENHFMYMIPNGESPPEFIFDSTPATVTNSPTADKSVYTKSGVSNGAVSLLVMLSTLFIALINLN